MTDRNLRIVLGALTLVAGTLYLVDLGGPVRYLVVVPFVLVCPGLAWARLLRIGDAADTLGVGIALSIALVTLVAQAMALASWWSPGVGYLVLAALTGAGLALEPREPAEPEAAPGR